MSLNGLPENWEVKKLGDVCEKVSVVKRKDRDSSASFLYLDIGGINNRTNRIERHKSYLWKDAPSRAQQIVRKNDVLFSTVRTYLKNIALIDSDRFDDQIASSGFTVIRANTATSPKFLFYYSISQQFLRPLNELQTGSSYPAVRDKDVFSQLIPAPPLAEQERIVAKIEELFSEVDAGVEGLKKAQTQLKTYRQAVLKSAFEGKLTNENGIDGELPASWNIKLLSEITSQVTDGDHMPPPKTTDGIPFITISNVKENKINFSTTFFVSEAYHDNLKESRRPALGDILYTVTGSFGIPILVDFEKKFCFQRHIGLVRPLADISQKWLYYALQSPQVFKQAVNTATGTAQKTVALKSLRNFELPFPAFKEQQRIVEEIESRLSVCDKLEETIAASLKQSEALRQSILKQAFEGKLIETL